MNWNCYLGGAQRGVLPLSREDAQRINPSIVIKLQESEYCAIHYDHRCKVAKFARLS